MIKLFIPPLSFILLPGIILLMPQGVKEQTIRIVAAVVTTMARWPVSILEYEYDIINTDDNNGHDS